MKKEPLFPFVSVIIPTYNRRDSLLRVLDSLVQQTLSPNQYEVIVVDNGSTDGTHSVVNEQFPFTLRYLKQDNRGATAARNEGAMNSQGKILVFMDDDITLRPQTLEHLVGQCFQETKVIVLGTLITPDRIKTSVFAQVNAESPITKHQVSSNGFVHFSNCMTGLLVVKRSDFFNLDMFQDPTGGWPNWDDVDFGYRAHLSGFQFRQHPQAIGEHWDYALTDLATDCQRWWRASKSAVRLFQKYPDMRPYIPMFHDKVSIAWGQDSPSLIVRKVVRIIASSRPILWGLEQLVSALEQRYPSPTLLRPLYRWVAGGYMFQGYRAGMREYGPVRTA